MFYYYFNRILKRGTSTYGYGNNVIAKMFSYYFFINFKIKGCLQSNFKLIKKSYFVISSNKTP